jgi:hypothetical protein
VGVDLDLILVRSGVLLTLPCLHEIANKALQIEDFLVGCLHIGNQLPRFHVENQCAQVLDVELVGFEIRFQILLLLLNDGNLAMEILDLRIHRLQRFTTIPEFLRLLIQLEL